MNLENWELVVAPGGMYVPPDHTGCYIRGNIYGHPNIPDGTYVQSSVILGWDFRDACFVDESRLELRLKEPAADYERRFPNALGKIEKAVTARKFMMPTWLFSERYKEAA